jgi:hypothetical protein
VKVVFIGNHQDAQAQEKQNRLVAALSTADGAQRVRQTLEAGQPVATELLTNYVGELHVANFMTVRDILPIRTAPSVFILFDELEETVKPETLLAVIDAAINRNPVKPLILNTNRWQVKADGVDAATLTAEAPTLADGDTVTFAVEGSEPVEVVAAGGKATLSYTTTVAGWTRITASHPTLGSFGLLIQGVA